MKKLLLAALVAAQVTGPAAAADLVDERTAQERRMGAFAGARLRISLDAEPRERVRAGIALAPTLQTVRQDGTSRSRIGEGLEYGLADRRAPELSIAGQPVSALAEGGRLPDGRRQNLSPIAWVGIAVGVAVIAYAVWFTNEMNEPHD